MMKKFLLICTLMMSMAAIAQDGNEPLETIYQKFAFTLFNKVVEEGNKNVILSPFSAQVALSMLQNGAVGNTLSEIQEAMGTNGYSNEQVNAYNLHIAELLTYRPEFNYDDFSFWGTEEKARDMYEKFYPVFETANGVWAATGYSISEIFKELMANCYDAEVGNVDFGTQEGVDFINGWVSEKTHQLIPFILDEPNGDIAVLLTNALYFNGCWATPFITDMTRKENFYLADGNKMEVDMMKVDDISCRATTSNKFKTVTLPYGQGAFSMTIFLPIESQSIPQLTYEDWLAATDASVPFKEYELRMPKFEIDGKYDMVDIFKSLGMEDAFCGAADFSQMGSGGLLIDDIYQSGKICVYEKGTESAAVTVVEMHWGIPSPPDTFVVDHPFYFTLENNVTHTILFVGRMMEIGKPANSPDDINTPISMPTSARRQYDLQGRALRQAPAKGIYIQEGKKHLK